VVHRYTASTTRVRLRPSSTQYTIRRDQYRGRLDRPIASPPTTPSAIGLDVSDDNIMVHGVPSNATRPFEGKYRGGGLPRDDAFGLLIVHYAKSIIRPRRYYAGS
jgi:hypothetical protein